MKHIRRIFSVAMITCVVFLEIAPALPAYAFTNPVVANKEKVKMNIDEAMEYFNVPNDVRETVRQYRDSVGMFAKKNVASKDFLQSYIQSLLPIESLAITKAEDNLGENFVDI